MNPWMSQRKRAGFHSIAASTNYLSEGMGHHIMWFLSHPWSTCSNSPTPNRQSLIGQSSMVEPWWQVLGLTILEAPPVKCKLIITSHSWTAYPVWSGLACRVFDRRCRSLTWGRASPIGSNFGKGGSFLHRSKKEWPVTTYYTRWAQTITDVYLSSRSLAMPR